MYEADEGTAVARMYASLNLTGMAVLSLVLVLLAPSAPCQGASGGQLSHIGIPRPSNAFFPRALYTWWRAHMLSALFLLHTCPLIQSLTYCSTARFTQWRCTRSYGPVM